MAKKLVNASSLPPTEPTPADVASVEYAYIKAFDGTVLEVIPFLEVSTGTATLVWSMHYSGTEYVRPSTVMFSNPADAEAS